MRSGERGAPTCLRRPGAACRSRAVLSAASVVILAVIARPRVAVVPAAAAVPPAIVPRSIVVARLCGLVARLVLGGRRRVRDGDHRAGREVAPAGRRGRGPSSRSSPGACLRACRDPPDRRRRQKEAPTSWSSSPRRARRAGQLVARLLPVRLLLLGLLGLLRLRRGVRRRHEHRRRPGGGRPHRCRRHRCGHGRRLRRRNRRRLRRGLGRRQWLGLRLRDRRLRGASSSAGGFPFAIGIETEASGDWVVVSGGADGRDGGVFATTTGRERTVRVTCGSGRRAGLGFTARTIRATTGVSGLTGVATTGTTTCCGGAEGSCTATPTATTPTAVEASGSKVAARCRKSIAFDCLHAATPHASLIRVIILPRKGASARRVTHSRPVLDAPRSLP